MPKEFLGDGLMRESRLLYASQVIVAQAEGEGNRDEQSVNVRPREMPQG